MVRTFLKVYMELGSYFLFLQEQIKDIITTTRPLAGVSTHHLLILLEYMGLETCLSSAKLRSTDGVNPRAVLLRDLRPRYRHLL
jgi:hypothetical protein